LKEEKKSCVPVARSSDTWPETTGIRKWKKRGKQLSTISLRCW